MTPTPASASASASDAEVGSDLVSEDLIEEVSIDGMCGVY